MKRGERSLWVCRVCERTWTGTVQAHCRSCHRHFSRASSFDLHWRGRGEHRECVDPATLLDLDGLPALKLSKDPAGRPWWVRRELDNNLIPWRRAHATDPKDDSAGTVHDHVDGG